MLVLTRKVNEAILIGDEVEVVVLLIKGDNVRIGIEAPREITVLRRELKEPDERRESA